MATYLEINKRGNGIWRAARKRIIARNSVAAWRQQAISGKRIEKKKKKKIEISSSEAGSGENQSEMYSVAYQKRNSSSAPSNAASSGISVTRGMA